jgi:hypothetical protein
MNSLIESTSQPRSAQDALNEAPSGETYVSAFVRCVERLETFIDDENRLLESCAPVDFERSNLRKARALMEFMQASRLPPPESPPIVMERLKSLQSKLRENGFMLERHLRATSEIAALLVKAIRLEQSDGTYSNRTPAR